MTTRKQMVTAHVFPTKGGGYTVVKPDGHASSADSLKEAEQIARNVGALVVDYTKVPFATQMKELYNDVRFEGEMA